MTRDCPASKWSIEGQRAEEARLAAGGKCSGMICAWMSMSILWPPWFVDTRESAVFDVSLDCSCGGGGICAATPDASDELSRLIQAQQHGCDEIRQRAGTGRQHQRN